LRIGWVVEQAYAEMLERVAPFAAVIPVRMQRWRRQPFARETRHEMAAAVRAMRGFTRGGAALDLQGLIKSSLLTLLSGAGERFGFAAPYIRERAAGLFLNRKLNIDPAGHVVEWNLDLASGVAGKPLPLPDVDYAPFASSPGRLDPAIAVSRPILLAPGAGQARKQWPVGRFAALARRITDRGLPVMVVWGPGEECLARAIAERVPAVTMAPPTSLAELAWLLRQARLLVAGDTGPLHLADALRTPVIGLYGPTDPARNGPFRQRIHCIESWTGGKTMDEIEVGPVFEELVKVVE
ncbi:MAG TPA: glycosyltransferase family 9 protein, partial [Thermoanaerobaculia bacterium]|nr:glycosyltransferase family 9 protein [Thermoanaerobaculia bacterium]